MQRLAHVHRPNPDLSADVIEEVLGYSVDAAGAQLVHYADPYGRTHTTAVALVRAGTPDGTPIAEVPAGEHVHYAYRDSDGLHYIEGTRCANINPGYNAGVIIEEDRTHEPRRISRYARVQLVPPGNAVTRAHRAQLAAQEAAPAR